MWRSPSFPRWIAAAATALAWAAVIPSTAHGATGQTPPTLIEVSGATRVEFDDATGVWELQGTPVIIARGPVTLRAPAARYDTKEQLVTAWGGVSYDDELLAVSAASVTVWVLDERAVADGDVSAVYRGGEQAQLSAARVEIFGRPAQITASGGAVLVHQRGTVTAEEIAYDETGGQVVASGSAVAETAEGTLRADQITAFLGRNELVADGNVVITRGDLEGRSARAIFRQQTGVAELSGGAVVRLGPHTISASAIAVDLRTRRVDASGNVHLVAYAQP